MALAFGDSWSPAPLFEDFRLFVKADPPAHARETERRAQPANPGTGDHCMRRIYRSNRGGLSVRSLRLRQRFGIAAWLENTFGWFAASVQYLVINIMGRADGQIASLSAPISMKICGWSKGGKAPTHMNSLAPTRTSGTPGWL